MEGVIKDGDKVLYIKEWRLGAQDKEIDINFEFKRKMTPESYEVITGIMYRDYWGDNTGAVRGITEGGINEDFLKFNVKGKTCMKFFPRGCHSKLWIFGK